MAANHESPNDDANEASSHAHDVELVPSPSGVSTISPNLMPSQEACELLGCTQAHLERLAELGLLSPVGGGKTATGSYSPSDLVAYLTR